MKKFFALILSAAVAITVLTGCDANGDRTAVASNGPITLKVVTEYATDATHGFPVQFANDALFHIVDEFTDTHENVKVELTFLPLDEDEREITMQKIRTELMAGDGSYVFLLPAGSVAKMEYTIDYEHPMEPLFADVHQVMENRVFADLSAYYDNDTALKTEELKQDIMDAGVYDSCRYVLPIGWTMPVVAVDWKRVKELGIEESVFSGSMLDIYNAAIEAGDAAPLLEILNPPNHSAADIACAFPNLFDYENDTLLLTEEEALQYYTMYNEVMEARKPYLSVYRPSEDPSSWLFFTEELVTYVNSPSARFCLNGDNAFARCSLCHAAEVLAIGKVEGLDFSLLPMPSIDGSTVAEITYFGAVSAGCEHPEEAYEFLRMFLTPEVQFQKTLSSGATHLRIDDCAWPVRVTGSVDGKYRVALEWAGMQEPVRDRSAFFNLELTDDDLSFIREPIDHVRFSTPFSYEFFSSVDALNDDLLVDNIEQKAAGLVTLAKYHIAES